ncbi:patatin-like phospholipase family protein [Aquabacterium sp.]|uniref:patatin-like phospholipase family protein n=1 Tax=Aquabacterium sp. TaxID=1872578 RepID=UPI0024873B0C|nr:patatin-like phospholipase family protein [Aquabacterium sp.]MDI1349391.1 patatin-like phospholipase family protein [Aquabacterium sp.]
MNTPNLPVTAADFLQHIDDLHGDILQLRAKDYSDLVDADGHQYIDLVMEGGGTLGLALLGYLHVLESAGLRFIGIGGTSAGAISAIALAAANTPAQPRVDKLIAALANMPMAEFVDGRKDGDSDAMEALQAWLDGDASTLRKVWKTTQVLDNLSEIHALNRGVVFQRWMDTLLRGMNQGQPMTVGALRERMNALPPLRVRDTADPEDFRSLPKDAPLWENIQGVRHYLVRKQRDQLCVVTADISTETKVHLPQMAELYWPQPDAVNVADFARASMSIPGFFATFQQPSLPANDATRALWQQHTTWPDRCYEGAFLPKTHHFVDGGVLSNFPIDAFHNTSRVPLRPTLGVKLQWDEHNITVKGLPSVIGGAFNTARHAMDNEFIKKNPDYKRLVGYIDTGKISWLDFGMARDTKLKLFRLGAESAIDFLRGFDWVDYKRVRRTLVEAFADRA